MSVVYIAVNESKILAVESESEILHFLVDKRTLFSESENEPISINVKDFNRYMGYRVKAIDRVYNTRKAGKDVISFSVATGNIQHHDIHCRISYFELVINSVFLNNESFFEKKTLYFENCGNNTVRFEDNAIKINYSSISGSGGIIPN